MKIAHFLNIIFISLIFCMASSAQDENRILAKIGSEKITAEEFINRFDFMPHLNYSSSNIDSVKKQFLYSLVAEKLWALEADELQIDTIETVKYSLQSLKNLFVKDELYKEVVESKINLTGEEISKGLSRVTRILSVKIITSSDSIKIFDFYKVFQSGANYDSVMEIMNLSQKPFEVKFGSLEDESVEDIVYSLKLNEITKPIKVNQNWFLFKLVNDEQDASIDLTKEHAKNIVIKKLKDRKSQKFGRIFLDSLLAEKSITADRRLFNLLADELLEILKLRSGKTGDDSLTDIQLSEKDILKVLSSLKKSDLSAAFIKLDNKPATIKDFLYYAIYQKIYIDSFNANKFKITLNRVVKKFIEDEIVAREGYKRKLDNLSSVKNDLQIWRNYYLSEVLMNSYVDSIKITDNEVQAFIEGKVDDSNTVLQVNILEILVDNIETVESILNELNEGKDFKTLASIYNQRKWTKQSDGEWGYFNSNMGGEIGKIAAGLKVGQIYGPLKVPEGYSIFKLIDKREISIKQQTITDKDSLKLIRIKLALSKMDNLINDKTVSLAKKYKISIDEQLLKSVETSKLNTFTYRFIGFGGKIAAFPITIPMYEWFYQYRQNKEIP